MKKVDQYLASQKIWKEGLTTLRQLLNETELEEDFKWGRPVYALNGKNVAGISGFKSYFGIWFFQGVFLSDPEGILINAQKGKTKALRQLRFDSEEELNKDVVRSYILEAIDNQKAGKEFKPGKKPLKIPPMLQKALDADPVLSQNFEQFGLTDKRAFAEHIASAKRDATKQSRLDKILPMIRKGEGIMDKYR